MAWFYNYKRFITSIIMLFSLLITGCNPMKKYPPEQFFHGTQLQLAQAIYDVDAEQVELLAKQTDLNKPGAQDMTLLFYALLAAKNASPERLHIMTLLVKAGADPVQRVPEMGTVAGTVARRPNPDFLKSLLEGGMLPDIMLTSTPLIFRAANDRTHTTLELLVQSGADINKRNYLGATVIFEALSGLQLDTVIWLLDHGADPTVVKTRTGWPFARLLSYVKERFGGNEIFDRKMDEIVAKAVEKGMVWPYVEE